jgi:hypothetical protein
MYFSEEALQQLRDAHQAVESKYHKLLMRYVTLPLKNTRAREFAIQGFPRRLKIMVRCIHNVFAILPPDRDELPTSDQLSDATINIQASVFNVFGCVDNLAWIWIQEKGLKTKNGKPIPRNEVGLSAKCEVVRNSFSNEFQEYLKTRDDWFDFMGNFRHALAHRISLYIPPHVVKPEDEAAYREFERQKMEATRRGQFAEYERLSIEQMKLARFRPWMQHSYEEKTVPTVFHPQLLANFNTIDELGWKMLEELKTLV